jgi:hypothetical protein
MLKVSVKEDSSGLALDVEGRLAGPWVAELEQCWKREEARTGGKPCSVRLRAVSFIDDAGKQLLSRMHESGAILEGNGCMVRAIVAGITRGSAYGAEEECADRPAIARPNGEKQTD